MKRVLLILVTFLVFDYCWARKLKEADHFLLDENHANRFLKVHKRWNPKSCNYAWEFKFEVDQVWKMRDTRLKAMALLQDSVKEECCAEGCNTEEMDENIHDFFKKDHAFSEPVREKYVATCCR